MSDNPLPKIKNIKSLKDIDADMALCLNRICTQQMHLEGSENYEMDISNITFYSDGETVRDCSGVIEYSYGNDIEEYNYYDHDENTSEYFQDDILKLASIKKGFRLIHKYIPIIQLGYPIYDKKCYGVFTKFKTNINEKYYAISIEFKIEFSIPPVYDVQQLTFAY